MADSMNKKTSPSAAPATALPEAVELEMQIDLLVDEELAEQQRKELLQKMDRQPGLWRSLSIRFLERQTERRSARQMVSRAKAPAVAPAITGDAPAVYSFPNRSSWGMKPRAIAAGLLVAAVSAVVTYYAMTPRVAPVVINPNLITAQLPGSVVGMKADVKIDVPEAKADGEAVSSSMFLQNADSETASPSKSSLVIQPDGKGGVVVVPVNTLTSVSWQ